MLLAHQDNKPIFDDKLQRPTDIVRLAVSVVLGLAVGFVSLPLLVWVLSYLFPIPISDPTLMKLFWTATLMDTAFCLLLCRRAAYFIIAFAIGAAIMFPVMWFAILIHPPD